MAQRWRYLYGCMEKFSRSRPGIVCSRLFLFCIVVAHHILFLLTTQLNTTHSIHPGNHRGCSAVFVWLFVWLLSRLHSLWLSSLWHRHISHGSAMAIPLRLYGKFSCSRHGIVCSRLFLFAFGGSSYSVPAHDSTQHDTFHPPWQSS